MVNTTLCDLFIQSSFVLLLLAFVHQSVGSVLRGLLAGETNVYFVGDAAMVEVSYAALLLGARDELTLTLPQDEVKELHRRWYQLRDNALEIFLTSGRTALLAFKSTKVSGAVSLTGAKCSDCHCQT